MDDADFFSLNRGLSRMTQITRIIPSDIPNFFEKSARTVVYLVMYFAELTFCGTDNSV